MKYNRILNLAFWHVSTQILVGKAPDPVEEVKKISFPFPGLTTLIYKVRWILQSEGDFDF
jgi:hypothetical protein